MSLVNSNCGFTKLEEVWLGDVYPANFYDHLPSDRRYALFNQRHTKTRRLPGLFSRAWAQWTRLAFG
jgi:hypothetical protein